LAFGYLKARKAILHFPTTQKPGSKLSVELVKTFHKLDQKTLCVNIHHFFAGKGERKEIAASEFDSRAERHQNGR